MSPDQPTLTTGTPSRRALLTGGVGLAGAVFLAACSSDTPAPGESGQVVSSTSTPATVPVTAPSAIALADDKTQIATAQSLELLVEQFYANQTPRLKDQTLADMARRFRSAHTEAAAVFGAADTGIKGADEPNEYLTTSLMVPSADSLNTDAAIVGFMQDLESMLTATYVNSVGIHTSAEWRQKAMTFGAASARRVTVLANGAAGAPPTGPLYPLTDLIPGDAFLGAASAEADGS